MPNNVQQSGSVTPGHLVTWTANGIVQDGGSLLTAQKVLGSIRGANFNLANVDQAIYVPPAITAFQITSIIVTNASVSLSLAQGGFYSQAGRGGSQIVSSGQTYAALTTLNALLQATLTTFGSATRFSVNNLSTVVVNNQSQLAVYFNLSTAQGVAATADIYLVGIDLT